MIFNHLLNSDKFEVNVDVKKFVYKMFNLTYSDTKITHAKISNAKLIAPFKNNAANIDDTGITLDVLLKYDLF